MGECGWMVYHGRRGEGGNMGNCKGGDGWVGQGGVNEGCDEEGGDGWKCGGGWEERDGWNRVGRDAWKGTCMPRATPGVDGGKKEVSREIVTLTCLCTQTCIHIHGLVY